MAKLDPQIVAHLEWIGFVRPTGLVVSAPALVRAGAILDRRDAEGQQRLRARVEEKAFKTNEEPAPFLPEFRAFAESVLGWSFSANGYAGTVGSPIPPELEVSLPDYGETIRPDFAVRELEPEEGGSSWQLLVRVLRAREDFDRIVSGHSKLEASAHGRMERLLRQTGVPAGILFNGVAIRLISAPRGESSGWLDLKVADMVQTAGRPISTALRLLLSERRLLALPRSQRLAALLDDSRKFQNEVSERLAEQVLHALYELLRGFQAAHDASKGELLREPLAEDPDEVYRALLTVILRLVFVLYAEERDMLPEDETFLRHYSLTGLFERLREDAALYPDTMNQRYGAWAQILVLFRMIHDGAEYSDTHLAERHGVIFDPDRFKFLEGRSSGGGRQIHERIEPPLVPDGTVYRALDKLLVLDGERISYRALDVEQIGSVYETMMGFRLERATGRSIAIKATKKHGAPTTINLEELLDLSGDRRRKWVRDLTGRKITDRISKVVKTAKSLEDLHAALHPVVDRHATPDLVPRAAMVLQPSEERRKSGSHYTPRSLTEPIVRTTLEPILKQLVDPDADLPTVYEPSPEDKERYTPGELQARIRLSEKAVEVTKQARQVGTPHPSQILDLKICDPAMGSGAFLVEACRQLGDELINAWYTHDAVPTDIPPDEDEVLYARRLVAQRCLYGVDKNDMAVDLAKLSLWLVTLAKDHPFTFLDHALRHGDSLVGLTRRQIIGFHWEPKRQKQFGEDLIQKRLDRATEARAKILNAREDESYRDQEQRLAVADQALNVVRLTGDACVSAFFAGSKKKEREDRCEELFASVSDWYASGHDISCRGPVAAAAASLRIGEHPIPPFHWEIEFPEVFSRENGGFDSFVGNPPFAYKNTLIHGHRSGYLRWLLETFVESNGNADLVAFFFRRVFTLTRKTGCFGLIATKTIAQGDTRAASLRWICTNGGTIYAAKRRHKWAGQAAVTVSIVHIARSTEYDGECRLDDQPVPQITAFLFHTGGHNDPWPLADNAGISYIGTNILGPGFTIDDDNPKATSHAEMQAVLNASPKCKERLRAYVSGENLNTDPRQQSTRLVIDFELMSLEEAGEWPELLAILEQKVKGSRGSHSRAPWWQFDRPRPELYAKIRPLQRVLVTSCVSSHLAFAFQPTDRVFSHNLTVLAIDDTSRFAVVQSRVHEVWVRLTSSTLEDRLGYRHSDSFATFPFPSSSVDSQIGTEYHDFRASLMVANDEGLTKTYNRFHDPHEMLPEIAHLRELHEAMDRAVLEAYGWDDLAAGARCEFLLDYEEEDDDEPAAKKSKKKKPWRLRWPDDFRDDVLARLLELNAVRATEEAPGGVSKKKKPTKKTKAKNAPEVEPSKDLFS